MKILKTAALLLLLAGTAAQAEPYVTDRFVDAKSGYVVDVDRAGDRMLLNGRHPATGATFRLRVSSAGNVTGVWDGKRIDYKMASNRAPNELASYQVTK